VYLRGGDRPVAWIDLTHELGPLEIVRPTTRGFESGSDLRRFLALAMPGRAPAVPRIDFRAQEAVLAATGPRSSTGYDIEVRAVREDRGRVVLRLRESTPRLGEPVAPRVTYPYRLVVLPHLDKPVHVVWEGRP
jgi:hypothetical protein